MRKEILHLVKAAVIAGCSALIVPAYSQQNIIANKDNTRPGTNNQNTIAAKVTTLTATKFNGYNEVHWTAIAEQDTRRFIAEYSDDGINYQTAGEMLPVAGAYSLKHHTLSTVPLLYRIRIEKTDGRFVNTSAVLLDGTPVPVVNIWPTDVKGDIVNANARFPVERASVVGSNGQQVYVKDLGGVSGLITLAIPSLQKGMYFVTFYGNGWKTTSKFVVAS